MWEKGWDYQKAAEYVREKYSAFSEIEKVGFVPDDEPQDFRFGSLEAGELLAEKAKELMLKENISYEAASEKVFSSPENEALVRSYTHAD